MELVRLRSGREIAIRAIRASDENALREAYERLSPTSQYQRFFASKPRLSAAEARYLTSVDGRDHYALVATPAQRADPIIGVGRFVRLQEDPQTAEFAVVVGDRFQREGIGAELVERLGDAARARGVTRFTATILAENKPAHRLMHRLTAGGLVPHGRGAARATERHLGTIDEVVVELAA